MQVMALEAEQKRLNEELALEAEQKRIKEKAEQKRNEEAVAAQKSPDELVKDILKMLPTDPTDKLKKAIDDIVHNRRRRKGVEAFDLSHVISDEGAKTLTEALKVNTALQSSTEVRSDEAHRRWRRRCG